MTEKTRKAFVGGEILSVNGDGILRKYEALALEDGKILYIGDESGLPEGCQIEKLEGRSIVPGFIDSHLHASSMTQVVFDHNIMLGQPGTMFPREEAIRMYREKLMGNRKESDVILRGMGWDPGIFMGTKEGYPTADDLAGIADDIPIVLKSYDQHFAWVNRKALEIAGFTKEDQDPRNGKIWRDSEGNPSGVFQEMTAIDALLSRIPDSDYTVEQYMEGIREFQKQIAFPLGLTGIFDAYNSRNGMEAYERLAKNGELKTRVRTCFYADPAGEPSQFDHMISEKGRYHEGDMFHVDAVKFFMDGSGLSFFMNKPFDPEWLKSIGMPEDYVGYPQWNQEEINELFLKLDSAGFQIHVHCMGDGAVKQTVNAFSYVAERNGTGRRHTIAHVMNADEEDLQKMAELEAIAAMQPMWAQYASLAETMSSKTLGMDRILDEYRIGTLIEKGCIVSFGTDFPVTIPPSPILGMQTAVTRSVTMGQPDYEQFKDRRLGPIDNPERDCISPARALECCCYGGAYQCFLEDITGSLKEGMSADFVILSGAFTKTEKERIESLQIEQTYFKGERVF